MIALRHLPTLLNLDVDVDVGVDLLALGVVHACEWLLRNLICLSSVTDFKEYLIPVNLVS